MSALFRLRFPASRVPDDAIRHCVARGVIGFGRVLPQEQLRDIEWAAWVAGTGRRVEAAAGPARQRWLASDDLVWARDGAARYYLGRVGGAWAIDESEEARAADVVYVVPCQLQPVGRDDALPSVVSRSFRYARPLHRIEDREAVRFSQVCWNALSASTSYPVDLSGATLLSVLDTRTLEEVALILLQSRGWTIVGRARDRDQGAHAATLAHRESAARATLLVAADGCAFNPQLLGDSEHGERTFLFSREGSYPAPPGDHVTCLDPAEVETFAHSNPELMPRIVAIWLRAFDG